MGKNVIIKGADFSDFGLGSVYNLVNDQGRIGTYYTTQSNPYLYPIAFPNSTIIGKTIIGFTLNVKQAGVFTVGKVTGFLDTNVLSDGEQIIANKTGVQTFFLKNPITVSTGENIYLGRRGDTLVYGYANSASQKDAEAPNLLNGFYTSSSNAIFSNHSTTNALGINLISQ